MGQRILIADDDKNIVELLTMYLEKEGYSVAGVYDGQAALGETLSKPYDLIVLDVMMPCLGGLEVCARIRELSSVPIILISVIRTEDIVKTLATLADDFMTKPFSPRELLARIKAILRRSTLVNGVADQICRICNPGVDRNFTANR